MDHVVALADIVVKPKHTAINQGSISGLSPKVSAFDFYDLFDIIIHFIINFIFASG